MRLRLIDRLPKWLRHPVRRLTGRLPDFPSAHEIDREYIEEETPDEIGAIGEMREIPDKAQRHAPEKERRRSKRAA